MSISFNLIDEKWIPCITTDGEFFEVSLRDFLAEAHELREISCETPIMSAAILPVALAILHRNFGPSGTREWGDLWQAGEFDMQTLNSYFDKWYERFDLFHPERPFYQVAVEGAKPSSVIHLIHSMGNTGTLFIHANEAQGIQLSAAEATLYLLASRLFHTAGTGPSVAGRKLYYKDGIFARGVIFWARGTNLFQTLMLNLVRYNDQYPMPRTARDMPAWEMNEPFKRREVPHGYLDYLTWSNNRILLIPNTVGGQVFVRDATVVPTLEIISDAQTPRPHKRYDAVEEKGKITYKPLRFTPEKAIWRDYHSLLPSDDKTNLPAVIRWCANLANYGHLPEEQYLQLMATGMSTKPGKSNTDYYRRETMPLPLHVLNDSEKMNDITNAIDLAKEIAKILSSALHLLVDRVMNKSLGNEPPSKDKNSRDLRQKLMSQWNAMQLYWAKLESDFWIFVNDINDDSDKAMKTWSATLESAARDSLQHAVRLVGDDSWALKGSIAAERYLRGQMNKLFSD